MSLRLAGAGFNFLVAACVGGTSPSLPGVRWSLAGVRRVGVALSHGCGRVSSPSGACGGLLGLDPRLVSLAWVLWCALVRRAVSCRALPCCTVLVCDVLRCALLCHAVPRRAVPWCAAPWRGWLRRIEPRRTVSCCGLLCRGVPCRGALHGGAVCRVASCCDVYRCAAVCGGPFSLPFRRGAGSALVRLARFVVRDVGQGYVAGWWLGGAVRCGVGRWTRSAGVRVCRSGWWVRRVSARLPSLGACALVPCPLGVLTPTPWCRGRVLFLFCCLGCCLCGGPCCGRGRCLAARAWWWAARRCSRRLFWWV